MVGNEMHRYPIAGRNIRDRSPQSENLEVTESDVDRESDVDSEHVCSKYQPNPVSFAYLLAFCYIW